jgi:hypothetical protein
MVLEVGDVGYSFVPGDVWYPWATDPFGTDMGALFARRNRWLNLCRDVAELRAEWVAMCSGSDVVYPRLVRFAHDSSAAVYAVRHAPSSDELVWRYDVKSAGVRWSSGGHVYCAPLGASLYTHWVTAADWLDDPRWSGANDWFGLQWWWQCGALFRMGEVERASVDDAPPAAWRE